ncbi:MAG: glutaminase [Marinicaulis sp.]|nr:glutaminase [Marinicaulis sp.]NNL87707.1 glutaminase [Marinicaulis sp.]
MDWNGALEHSFEEAKPSLGKGAVADYIPALAGADPKAFAMAVIGVDGAEASIGDDTTAFSIQSISKVFTLTMALSARREKLWKRVGREASGSPFNSIVQLEHERGVPRNPFINAGAIVVTDTVVSDHSGNAPANEILGVVRQASGNDAVRINNEIATSEETWGDRNRSLAYFAKSFGNLENPADVVLKTYFRQCAIEMTVRDLARAGLFLTSGGKDPLTGKCFLTRAQSNRVNALMMANGHYDMSGDFAFRVGLPGKSGVGGGILAIAPGSCAVAVWSPGLNSAGNSLGGTVAMEAFTDCTGLNVFSDKTPRASDYRE